MNYQQAVVDQIVQNLAFDVEAVPKNKSIRASSISQSTPLNVKIRVRKKDEILNQHDVSTIADDNTVTVQKVRLVSSDQTIMTFDVFMEAEFEKKPARKLHKQIIEKLKPGICLGAVDDDDFVYMPSSSYSANITEPTMATRSDGTLKQTFTLSKNIYQNYTVSTEPGEQKWLFGKCKPGGCLDPPFSEDKYSYKPSTRSGPERIFPEPNISKSEDINDKDVIECDISNNQTPSRVHDEDNKSNGRHSSFFDGGLFKKKRRSSDKSTNTNSLDKDQTNSVLNLYNVDSVTNSAGSNSIITYPPKILNDLRINDDKTNRSRGPSEDKSRRSFNDHSEPYFIPPKGINRIKEKDTLNQKDYPKRRSSDVSELRNTAKESFKMPVPIPIPIPVPIPSMSNRVEPEVIDTNEDILPTQSANIFDENVTPDKELKEEIKLKDTEVPLQKLQLDSVKGDTVNQPLKLERLVSSNVQHPTSLSESNLSDTKLQPIKKKESENNMKDITTLNKKTETEPLRMLVPDLVPKDLSESDIIKTQNMVPGNRLKEIKSNEKSLPYISSYSHEETNSYPNKYLRTKSDSINLEKSDNETFVTKGPTMKGDMESDSKIEQVKEEIAKPENQDDIKSEDNITTLISLENKIGIKDDTHKDSYAVVPNEVGSKSASITDNDFYKVESPDIDSSNKIDEIEKPVLSNAGNDMDTVNDEISQSYNSKDELFVESKSNFDDNIMSINEIPKFSNDGSASYITAPILIDKTAAQTNFGQLKQVFSTTNLFGESDETDIPLTTNVASRLNNADNEVVTPSTVSHELIGTKSIIYDLDDYIPSANTERVSSFEKRVILPIGKGTDSFETMPKLSKTSDDARGSSDDFKNKLNNFKRTSVVSSIRSTSTLRSVLKKDTISVELGFHSFLNDKNEKVLRTFDTATAPTRYPNDSVTVIKSQVRVCSNEIRIPVDSDHDMSIQIKKANTNQRVSISESGFINVVDNHRLAKQKSPLQGFIRNAEAQQQHTAQSDIPVNSVIDLYEQELVPLQTIIKNLRDEIDVLAAQQTTFKDKMFCPNKSKFPRLIHSHKKCIGCVRK